MIGWITMLIGVSFAMYQEVAACKRMYPYISDQAALELSMRPQGCIERNRFK